MASIGEPIAVAKYRDAFEADPLVAEFDRVLERMRSTVDAGG